MTFSPDPQHQMSIDAGAAQSTKFRSGFPRRARRTHLRGNVQETSALRPLTTSELIRETQAIALSVPAAQAADEQGACLRAVENQRNGDSALSLRAMINWCRANPRVRAEFMRLMGCSEGETDPDFHQALHLLIQAQIRREAAAAEDLAPGAPPAADLFGGTR